MTMGVGAQVCGRESQSQRIPPVCAAARAQVLDGMILDGIVRASIRDCAECGSQFYADPGQEFCLSCLTRSYGGTTS